MPSVSPLLLSAFVALLALAAAFILWRQHTQAQRRARNLRALLDVSRQAATHLDRQQVLEVVVQAVQDVMGYHMASILLRAPDEPVLISAAVSTHLRDRIPLGDRVPVGRGMVGVAAATGETQLANDVTRDPHYVRAPGSWDPGSELSVPLKTGGRVVGVLDVEDERRGAFGADDVQILEALAEQLVVILDNARLFADAQSNLDQLAALYDLSQRLSLAGDTMSVMRTALEALAVHSRYRCTVAVFDFDPAGQPTRFYVPFYFQPGQGIVEANSYIPVSDDPLNPLLDAGGTVAIEHVESDPRVPAFLREDQIASGRPALALIPLVAGGRRIGNLVLSHTARHAWTDSELRLFRSAANQIAAALDNARRFAEERERTERLALIARVGQAIAARLDPDDLLATTADALHGVLGYDHVAIFLLDEPPGQEPHLVQRARASLWPRGEAVCYRQPISRGIIGAAAVALRPEIVNDVTADPRYVAVPNAGIRSEVAVPILQSGRLWGVIDVAGAQPFSEGDLSGLAIVADQLAVALENASLYERAQTAGELEERQRLARELHDSVTQLVFSLTLIAQSVAPAYRRDPAEGERRIGRMFELSQQALAEMRALLAELRPVGPVPNGLLPALDKLRERVAAREALTLELEAAGYTPHPRDYEEALYRIVQEALNNVVKHASARRVHIRLSQTNDRLTLTVTDDGQGFDPAAPHPANAGSGLGLAVMRERVERLGGEIVVDSSPGAGTTVRASFPLSPSSS